MRTCRVCKKRKPAGAFAIKRGSTRNRECKACKNAYNRGWYAKNRSRHIAAVGKNNQRYKLDRREWLWPLKNKPCTDCRRKFPPYVMDFDHVVPGTKVRNISTMTNRKQILAEITKCNLVCANCHRIRTFKRLNARSPTDGSPPSKRL